MGFHLEEEAIFDGSIDNRIKGRTLLRFNFRKELCFLIVQEFVINTADGSEEKQELHSNLLKLQEQIAGAFIHLDHDGEFDDIPATIRLLTAVLPLLDRTAESARYLAETTYENLLNLKEGIIALRKELQA